MICEHKLTKLNDSKYFCLTPRPEIYMAPLIKNPYDFYKVLTFKWHMSKFELNQIISLQITVI